MGCISDRGMQGLDRWITDGNSHYCEFCKTHWSDCDGGCECAFCESCGERTQEEDLNEDEICEECVNTSCSYCGDAKGVVQFNGGLFCPVCYREELEGHHGS